MEIETLGLVKPSQSEKTPYLEQTEAERPKVRTRSVRSRSPISKERWMEFKTDVIRRLTTCKAGPEVGRLVG